MLSHKNILITGMLSSRSIAYGVAKAMHREGAALAFTYQGEAMRGRVTKLAGEFDSNLVFPCDVTSDDEIATLILDLGGLWDSLHGIVHAVAFAPRDALTGDFHDTVNRDNFRIAHDISSYSLAALVKAALPLVHGRNAAVVAMSYLGAVRAIPNYNVMGLAKASLEACIRYLAYSLGPAGIRINGISAGPIRTLAAAGIRDFNKLLGFVEKNSALRRNITTSEVGNVAAFLCSNLASGITGEIIYVDGGFRIAGLGRDQY